MLSGFYCTYQGELYQQSRRLLLVLSDCWHPSDVAGQTFWAHTHSLRIASDSGCYSFCSHTSKLVCSSTSSGKFLLLMLRTARQNWYNNRTAYYFNRVNTRDEWNRIEWHQKNWAQQPALSPNNCRHATNCREIHPRWNLAHSYNDCTVLNVSKTKSNTFFQRLRFAARCLIHA